MVANVVVCILMRQNVQFMKNNINTKEFATFLFKNICCTPLTSLAATPAVGPQIRKNYLNKRLSQLFAKISIMKQILQLNTKLYFDYIINVLYYSEKNKMIS